MHICCVFLWPSFCVTSLKCFSRLIYIELHMKLHLSNHWEPYLLCLFTSSLYLMHRSISHDRATLVHILRSPRHISLSYVVVEKCCELLNHKGKPCWAGFTSENISFFSLLEIFVGIILKRCCFILSISFHQVFIIYLFKVSKVFFCFSFVSGTSCMIRKFTSDSSC